jgi:Rps23 Pro-64 3,4-dihydroxylase Tpa1-like proline 4-hydroxylase
MTIEESKEKLKKEGYTWFELNEFDSEFYEWLKEYKCNEQTSIKDKLKGLRCDFKNIDSNENIQFRNDFETHEEATEKKNEFLDVINTDNVLYSQMWYYTDLRNVVDGEEINKFEKYIKNMMIHFFNFEETQEYSLFAPSFTYYNDGCYLQNHSDGTGTGRICALLIYLNESYDEKDGGVLILNDTESVIPTFGKVALIDLQTFDIKHMVTKVEGGMGRYALLSFIKTKENEFVDY